MYLQLTTRYWVQPRFQTTWNEQTCMFRSSWSFIEWMNIYFTEVFRLVHHFTCIYTSSWISHTSDSHKSFNIDIYISFVLPAVCASFIQGLYFWFRVFKVIIPVYQYITKFFLRFSILLAHHWHYFLRVFATSNIESVVSILHKIFKF